LHEIPLNIKRLAAKIAARDGIRFGDNFLATDTAKLIDVRIVQVVLIVRNVFAKIFFECDKFKIKLFAFFFKFFFWEALEMSNKLVRKRFFWQQDKLLNPIPVVVFKNL